MSWTAVTRVIQSKTTASRAGAAPVTRATWLEKTASRVGATAGAEKNWYSYKMDFLQQLQTGSFFTSSSDVSGASAVVAEARCVADRQAEALSPCLSVNFGLVRGRQSFGVGQSQNEVEISCRASRRADFFGFVFNNGSDGSKCPLKGSDTAIIGEVGCDSALYDVSRTGVVQASCRADDVVEVDTLRNQVCGFSGCIPKNGCTATRGTLGSGGALDCLGFETDFRYLSNNSMLGSGPDSFPHATQSSNPICEPTDDTGEAR